MEFNNKKLSRTTTIVHYVISILLAAFLIGLANRIIWDIDESDNRPTIENFESQTDVATYRKLYSTVQDSINEQYRSQEALEINLELAKTTLSQEQRSFKSWISTRTATQSSTVDAEVRKRNLTMDSIQNVIQSYEKEKSAYAAAILTLRNTQAVYSLQEQEAMEVVYNLHDDAVRSYELSIFLKRLLFVLPILLLGLWMLVKKRKHTYWPLYRGFVFFSFYSFFVGLVPYLPSYGGYVRYTIGILLSLFLGVYAIRSLQAFIKRKKEELQQSTQERSKQIKEEVAEKALENHMCPSCGKDYLINEFHQSGGKKGVAGNLKVTSYCRHCGLQLFKDCNSCETTNYAHLPHCYSCGDHIMEIATEEKIEGEIIKDDISPQS
jgi:hypothetical protein